MGQKLESQYKGGLAVMTGFLPLTGESVELPRSSFQLILHVQLPILIEYFQKE